MELWFQALLIVFWCCGAALTIMSSICCHLQTLSTSDDSNTACLTVRTLALIILSPMWPMLLLGLCLLRCDRSRRFEQFLQTTAAKIKRRWQSWHSDRAAIAHVNSQIHGRHVSQFRNRPVSNNEQNHKTAVNLEVRHVPIVYVNKQSKLHNLLHVDSTCPICLAPIFYQNISQEFITKTCGGIIDDDRCVTTCEHVLHYKCLQDWLRLNSTCPVCRTTQQMTQCKVLRKGYSVNSAWKNSMILDPTAFPVSERTIVNSTTFYQAKFSSFKQTNSPHPFSNYFLCSDNSSHTTAF